MKPTIAILTSLLLLIAINVNGQKKSAPRLRVQVEAGVSRANMIIDPKIPRVDPFSGAAIVKFTPGIWGNLRLSRKTNFEFGIHHYQSGTRHFQRKDYKEEFILKYLRLHTNFKYQLINGKNRSNLFITAGPYLSYLGSGIFTYNGGPVIAHKGPYKSYKRFDYGLAFSVGYMTPAGLYTRISYAHGLPNVYKPFDETDLLVLKNVNNWMFNIGYQF